MKIAILGPIHPYRSGEAITNTLLAKNLGKNHEVVTFSFKRLYPQFLYPGRDQKYKKKKKFDLDIRFIIDSINPVTWLSLFFKIKKENPKVIVVTWWTVFLTPFYLGTLSLIRFFTEIRICFLVHNVVPHQSGFMDKDLAKALLTRGHYYVVLSNNMLGDLKSFLPEARVKRLIEPLFDEFIEIEPLPEKRAREKLKLKGNVILFFGLVRPFKGLKCLVEAMEHILKEIDMTLLVVGEFWEDKEGYLELIDKLGIKEKVRIIDEFVEDEEAVVYFSAADVVVLPYEFCTHTAVIQVAYAYNKPVIVTDVEGLTDDVEDGVTGYIVEPGNPIALAEAIVAYFKDKKKEDFTRGVIKKKEEFAWNDEKEKILFHGL